MANTPLTYEAALNALLNIERELRDGPGIRERIKTVRSFLAIVNDYEVDTHNLMNGKPCKIDARLKGTCCDPATERYWSM